MFRKVHASKMKLKDIRATDAESLFKIEPCHSVKRFRPSSSDVEKQLVAKKKRGNVSHLPPKEVRQDAVAHWPKHANDRQRCKMPVCYLFSYVKCLKYGIALCLKENNEYFTSFHTK